MAKKLTELVQQYRRDAEETVKKITDYVFNSGDFDLIDKYVGLVDKLGESVDRNDPQSSRTFLLSFLQSAGKSLEDIGCEGSSEDLKTSGSVKEGGKIDYRDAVALWQSFDGSRGNQILTDGGYTFRIRAAAKKGLIKVERNGRNRIVCVDNSDFEKLMNSYKPAPTSDKIAKTRDWISRDRAAELLREKDAEYHVSQGIELERDENHYFGVIDHMVSQKAVSFMKTSQGILIDRDEFVGTIYNYLNGKGLNSAARNKIGANPTPYQSFVYLVEQEHLTKQEALDSLGVPKSAARSILGCYSRYRGRAQKG